MPDQPSAPAPISVTIKISPEAMADVVEGALRFKQLPDRARKLVVANFLESLPGLIDDGLVATPRADGSALQLEFSHAWMAKFRASVAIAFVRASL